MSYLRGNWALVMVVISFFMALLSFLLIKVMGFGRKRAAVLLVLILVPPAAFVLHMMLDGQIGT